MTMAYAGCLFLFLSLFYVQGTSSLFFQTSTSQYRCLPGVTTDQLNNLTGTMADMTQFYSHFLPRILIPRVPDSPTHTLVRQFIEGQMRELGWTVELDSFDDVTPFGTKPFSNIIATLNPRATKRIVFACHYDSKIMAGHKPFLGATDSAVPCALMIDTAWKMREILPNIQATLNGDVTPQFIFFDGEEAMVRWTQTDSLYGSRHLAAKWRDQLDPNDGLAANNLENIELFVLLDLIGGPNMKFADYFSDTSMHFYNLYQIEYCLANSRIIASRANRRPMFDLWASRRTNVEDDHVPFMQQGVPILHLISVPFPDVWHRLEDDLDHLDAPTISEFATILRMFFFRLFSGAG